jgi:hypothetical protein
MASRRSRSRTQAPLAPTTPVGTLALEAAFLVPGWPPAPGWPEALPPWYGRVVRVSGGRAVVRRYNPDADGLLPAAGIVCEVSAGTLVVPYDVSQWPATRVAPS